MNARSTETPIKSWEISVINNAIESKGEFLTFWRDKSLN